MRTEYFFKPGFPYFQVKTMGVLNPAGFEKFLQGLVDHPDWRRGINLLSDYRDADASRLSAEDIREMAAVYVRYSERIGPGRSALLVAESLEYGIARMWISWTEMKVPREVRVFTSLDEATAWLSESDGSTQSLERHQSA